MSIRCFYTPADANGRQLSYRCDDGTSALYLWTDKGAARRAVKMMGLPGGNVFKLELQDQGVNLGELLARVRLDGDEPGSRIEVNPTWDPRAKRWVPERTIVPLVVRAKDQEE